jgi:hypothetical protein
MDSGTLAKGMVDPPGLTDDDRALLATIAQAISSLKRGPGSPWEETAEHLRRDGWEITWHLAWVADARRSGTHEQAVGRTLEEAFAQLHDFALLDTVEGCP